jgi:hypothetical protein
MGAEGVQVPVLLAAVPHHLLVEAIAAWRTASSPTTMECVRVALTLNAVRIKFNMEPVDLLPAPAVDRPVSVAAASGGGPAQVVAAASATIKVKLSQVIDQGSDQEVPMLPPGELNEMRRRYIAIHGDPPLQRCEVSDAQLTALAFKVKGGLAPYADFGVWGPHGARLERRMKFVSHVLSPDGSWRSVELPGADCLDTWRDCWAVFRSAAIMANVALPATLDRYESMFVERCRRYPTAWHLCAQADIRARSELVVEERRKQEVFHSAHPTMSVFDVTLPWNSVLKSAAGDAEFWDRELKEPAMLYMVGHGRSFPSHVERLPELPDEREKRKRKRPQGGGHQPKHPAPSAGKGRGKGKGGGKGGGDSGNHPRKSRSGRYFTDRQGKELCFHWGRNAGGCVAGPCPNGRTHACEICLQPHRTIDHKGGDGGSQGGGKRHT